MMIKQKHRRRLKEWRTEDGLCELGVGRVQFEQVTGQMQLGIAWRVAVGRRQGAVWLGKEKGWKEKLWGPPSEQLARAC